MSESEDPTPTGASFGEEFERAVLGEDPAFTAAQVAQETGVSLDQAERLWRALGFPEHGSAVAFTQGDVGALGSLQDIISSGLLDFDLAVNLTRAVGQTMARLSDWEVSALVQRVEDLDRDQREAGAAQEQNRTDLAMQMIEGLSKPFEGLLLYAWRRHLAAAVARTAALGSREEDLHTKDLTVGFADIVSFTALSNELSEQRIGDLVELFEARCADVVATHRGRVIKSIGDSVLFVNDDPIRAYDTAEGIINVIGRDPRMPDVRLGLASGTVVMRLGDVFGPPVNMAARLTSVARRNRIIIDAHTADLLPSDQFETRPLPARPVRGFGLVEPVAVRRH
ncbi:adenylate/guanylate cyclase domain-containing protein [Nocardioides sp.]|uniref:adenylate/guanylate cyclase domain-containing protein n=1 Tax=Nocardioides sp. TaxID=35761 RepID=UPI0035621C48